MKIFSISVLACISLQFANAQIRLPKVPEFQSRHYKIKGAFIPRDEFLSLFPAFTSRGIYLFDVDNILTRDKLGYNYDRDYYSGLYEFNNSEFQVVEEVSQNNLAGLGKILIQFTSDCDLSKVFFSRFPFGKSKSALSYIKQNTRSNTQEDYDHLNEIFKQSATTVFDKKKPDGYLFSDLGTLDFPQVPITNFNVILQFVYVQFNIWGKNKTTDRFPSHYLAKLLVKNSSGDVLTSYGQGLFMEGIKDKNYKEVTEPMGLYKLILPIVFDNLVNRFLNDTTIVNHLKKDRSEIDYLRKNNPHFDSLSSYQDRYHSIRSKKQQLLFDLYPINSSYDDIVSDNQIREKETLNRDKAWDTNIFTSLLAANNTAINRNDLKERIKQNEIALFYLEQLALSLNQEEKKLIEEINFAFTNPFDVSFILGPKELEDNQINALFSKLSNKKRSTFDAFQKTNNSISDNVGPAFTNNLHSFFRELNSTPRAASPNSVESMAATNGGTGAKNMDACQQKATNEWYKSPEYTRYMKTKLHADASDCKAKVIELTIQYCGDKLPPNELSALKKAAANERILADQLRSANQLPIKIDGNP